MNVKGWVEVLAALSPIRNKQQNKHTCHCIVFQALPAHATTPPEHLGRLFRPFPPGSIGSYSHGSFVSCLSVCLSFVWIGTRVSPVSPSRRRGIGPCVCLSVSCLWARGNTMLINTTVWNTLGASHLRKLNLHCCATLTGRSMPSEALRCNQTHYTLRHLDTVP